jgi:hypothetical protein
MAGGIFARAAVSGDVEGEVTGDVIAVGRHSSRGALLTQRPQGDG